MLFTHRHSLDTFKQVLPPHLKVSEATAVKHTGTGAKFLDNLVGDGPWGLCHVAVIERVEVAVIPEGEVACPVSAGRAGDQSAAGRRLY